jgi:hypothetical protein
MTTIRISDGSMLELLLADLSAGPDAIAAVVAPNMIEVRLLGSYNTDAGRSVVLSRIREWEAVQRSRGLDVHVEITDRSVSSPVPPGRVTAKGQ